MLQHYLLFFTTRFNALSLISMTHQHRPLQVCKGQTHREQLFFQGRFEHEDHDRGTWTKRNGNKTCLLFSQQGNQSFGLENFSWSCKESCPSVLNLPDCSFPINVPFLREKHPTALPALDFHMWGISRVVFEIWNAPEQSAACQATVSC